MQRLKTSVTNLIAEVARLRADRLEKREIIDRLRADLSWYKS